MFYRELVSLNIEGGGSETEVFTKAADTLEELGFVNKDYLQGIINREAMFPTGLITKYLNIALPHSEPEYINKPFVYVVRLKKPIFVKQMGDNQEMAVKNLFFLGIKNPKKQVAVLQAFMNLFMNEKFVGDFLRAEEEEEIYQLLTKSI